MFHHDFNHSGASDTAAPGINQTLWKVNTGGQMGSPTVADGVVYAGSYDTKIYAFDTSSGSLIWSFITGGRVVSCPAVSGGIVYVGSEDHKLYALNSATGASLWNFTTGYYVD
jgi:outer membrane protein assembly factor BamB